MTTYPRYASFTRDQCERTALELLHHAWVSGDWKGDLVERLTELRRIASYEPVPGQKRAEELAEDDARVVWRTPSPAEEIAGLG